MFSGASEGNPNEKTEFVGTKSSLSKIERVGVAIEKFLERFFYKLGMRKLMRIEIKRRK